MIITNQSRPAVRIRSHDADRLKLRLVKRKRPVILKKHAPLSRHIKGFLKMLPAFYRFIRNIVILTSVE